MRQVAPDAQVLAIRIMHSDDILYEGDIICALGHLAKRIARGQARTTRRRMVDVVSLSFGYFSESAADKVVTSGLWQAIKVLLDLGVVVVAAAGNFATSRKFYPAAFALEPAPAGQVPVISVGALNPNGTKAMFSNDGHWVTAWASGAAWSAPTPSTSTAAAAPSSGSRQPGAMPPASLASRPRGPRPGRLLWRLRGLERHVVLGPAAGRAHRRVAAGGRGRSGLRTGRAPATGDRDGPRGGRPAALRLARA